jgi:peptidoglycan-N-acetylglucosamine deacetylase
LTASRRTGSPVMVLHGEAPQNGADRVRLRPTYRPKSLQDFVRCELLTRQTWVHRNALVSGRRHLRQNSAFGYSMFRVLLILLCCAATTAAQADSCPGNPDALGTERLLAVDIAISARVVRKHLPDPLLLAATFFPLGRKAIANPELACSEHRKGHATAYHTFDHPLLDRTPLSAAEAEIAGSAIAVNSVVYSRAAASPVAPFFRFPAFASSPALLDRLNTRGIAIFGADLWASDWSPMTPEQEFAFGDDRLRAEGGGIVLFHATRSDTATMLSASLKALKDQGYCVAHVVPAVARASPNPHKPSRKSLSFLWKST